MALKRCCIGRGVSAIRHKTGNRSYTYYAMLSLKPIFDGYEAEGTVFGSIGKEAFQAIKFVSPLNQTIKAFEKNISPLDQMIENNVKESNLLCSVRDSLLPKLMSGKMGVKNV